MIQVFVNEGGRLREYKPSDREVAAFRRFKGGR